MDQLYHLMITRQPGTDIKTGPVFSADIIELSSREQYVFAIAHHLVVDLVSYRIVVEDLENLLAGQSSVIQLWGIIDGNYELTARTATPQTVRIDVGTISLSLRLHERLPSHRVCRSTTCSCLPCILAHFRRKT